MAHVYIRYLQNADGRVIDPLENPGPTATGAVRQSALGCF